MEPAPPILGVPKPLGLDVSEASDAYLSIKEWLATISAKLDRLDQKLEGKADLTSVQAIDIRVGNVEREQIKGSVRAETLIPRFDEAIKDIEELRRSSAKAEAVDSYRRWVWGAGLIGLGNLAWNVINGLKNAP